MFLHPSSCFLTSCLCEGDGRGDACQNDFDGDGVIDAEDNCPVNPLISQTNFTSYLNISVDFRPSTAPEWIITDQVSVSHKFSCSRLLTGR